MYQNIEVQHGRKVEYDAFTSKKLTEEQDESNKHHMKKLVLFIYIQTFRKRKIA